MLQRVRAAGVVIDRARMLLVNEGVLPTGERFWIPPGGGLETSDASLAECVRREVREETGLDVVVLDVLFVREYLDLATKTLQVEIFFRAGLDDAATSASPAGRPDRDWAWFTWAEVQDLAVFPEELKLMKTWTDPNGPPAEPRQCYLGRSSA